MEMGASIAAASCRDRVWGSGLAALLLALFPWATPLADSDSARGQVEILSAYTEFRDDVFYVNARIDYRLNQSALDALENGVRLNVELDVDVRRRRRLIWDPAVAELRQRYRLSYHALSERYVVSNLNSGDVASFSDLATALSQLGRIDRLPLIDAPLLDDDSRYDVSIRAVLDVKDLPGPLNLLSRFWGDWRIASERYSWRLER
jgi:hypothetical protein